MFIDIVGNRLIVIELKLYYFKKNINLYFLFTDTVVGFKIDISLYRIINSILNLDIDCFIYRFINKYFSKLDFYLTILLLLEDYLELEKALRSIDSID